MRRPASENDYSVALKFTYGDFELFAGGDLSGATLHRDFKGNREAYHDVACEKHQDDLYQRVIPQYAPDVVVLVHQGYDDALIGRRARRDDGRGCRCGAPVLDQPLCEAALLRLGDSSASASSSLPSSGLLTT